MRHAVFDHLFEFRNHGSEFSHRGSVFGHHGSLFGKLGSRILQLDELMDEFVLFSLCGARPIDAQQQLFEFVNLGVECFDILVVFSASMALLLAVLASILSSMALSSIVALDDRYKVVP